MLNRGAKMVVKGEKRNEKEAASLIRDKISFDLERGCKRACGVKIKQVLANKDASSFLCCFVAVVVVVMVNEVVVVVIVVVVFIVIIDRLMNILYIC